MRYYMKHIGKLTMAAVIATSTLSATSAQAAVATTTQYAVLDNLTASLNIRTSASTKSKVVGKYAFNDKVKVIKSYNKDWYQVLYKGKKRYVSKKYVAKLPAVFVIGSAKTDKGVNLNVRASKSTKSKIIGTYKNNQDIYISKANYNSPWYQVIYKGKIGYVHTDYVDNLRELLT